MFRLIARLLHAQFVMAGLKLAGERHLAHFLLVDEDLRAGGILGVLHGDRTVDGREREIEVDGLALLDLDVLDGELEAVRFGADDVLARMERDQIAFVEAVVADLLVHVEALERVGAHLDLAAADVEAGVAVEDHAVLRADIDRKQGEGRLEGDAVEQVGVAGVAGDEDRGVEALEAVLLNPDVVLAFLHLELVGQHAGVLVHIDDGPLRHGMDRNGVGSVAAAFLRDHYVGSALLPHRDFDDTLAGGFVLVGLDGDEDHILIDRGRAPVGNGAHFPFLARGHIDAVAGTGVRHQHRIFRQVQVAQFRELRAALADEAVGLGLLVGRHAGRLLGGVQGLDGQVVLLARVVFHCFVVAHVERLLREDRRRCHEDEQQQRDQSFHRFKFSWMVSNSASGLMDRAYRMQESTFSRSESRCDIL